MNKSCMQHSFEFIANNVHYYNEMTGGNISIYYRGSSLLENIRKCNFQFNGCL